ncbi:NprX family peptide pheromone [Bacillus sp. 123MFChir2]|nr:NprX family peptide pheromone [Bacillus sp. 123MFChir2]
MKKVVIGMILTMVALVVIANPQYANKPDVFGQAADIVETVNV